MSRYLHRCEDYECVTDVHVILSIIYSAYIAHFSYTFYIHTRYSRDKIEIYHVLFALFTSEIDGIELSYWKLPIGMMDICMYVSIEEMADAFMWILFIKRN